MAKGVEKTRATEKGVASAARVAGVAETLAANGAGPVVNVSVAVGQLVGHGIMELAVADGIVGVIGVEVELDTGGTVKVALQSQVTLVDGGPSEGVTVAVHGARFGGRGLPRFVVGQEGTTVAARTGKRVGHDGGWAAAGGVRAGNLPGGLMTPRADGAVEKANWAARALVARKAALQAAEAEGEIVVGGRQEERRGRRGRLIEVSTTGLHGEGVESRPVKDPRLGQGERGGEARSIISQVDAEGRRREAEGGRGMGSHRGDEG